MKLRLEMPSLKSNPIGWSKLKRHSIEYVVVKWYKSVGQNVDYGEPLADLKANLSEETAKAFGKPLWWIKARSALTSSEELPSLQIASNDQGVLKEINVPAGGCIKEGDLLALFVTKDEELTATANKKTGKFRVIANLRESSTFGE